MEYEKSKLLEKVQNNNEKYNLLTPKLEEPTNMSLEEKIDFLISEIAELKKSYQVMQNDPEKVTILIGGVKFQGKLNMIK